MKAFENSDIIFQRGVSNAPFIPIGFLGARAYSESTFETPAGESVTSTQQGGSAMGVVPFLLTDSDALFTGVYASTNRFDTDSSEIGDFRVSSIGLPLALFRQVNPQWQAAAFVMPFAHYSDLENAEWSLQTMGGAFARYTQNERLWWAFGLFADHSDADSYVLPYLGASWVVNPRWTISAIMPWPSVMYAPSTDWLFSFGASPSGASWSLGQNQGDVAVNLDSWDLGFTVERRLTQNLWISARTGIGGLRNLRFDTDDNELGETQVSFDSNGFISISLRLRPGAGR
ncbi:MAG: DUF6268 family outer membrane beta-barrel protein [Pseudomonadota bacterium]